MRLRSRGFTLAELLVTIVLLVAFLGFAAKFVMDALDSQDYDRRTRVAQVAVRTALDNIINDMRTAAVFPSSASISNTTLPCGILYPSSRDSSFNKNKKHKTSLNQLVLLHVDSSDVNNLKPYNYSAVLYTVVRGNRILRISNGLTDWSNVASYNGTRWEVASFPSLIHASTGGAASSYSDVNLRYGDNQDLYDEYGVVRLAGKDDLIHFWIGHDLFKNPNINGSIDNSGYGEKRYETFYDRSLFNVKVIATVFYKGTSGGEITSATYKSSDGELNDDKTWPPEYPAFKRNARCSQVEASGSVRIQSSLDY